MQYCTYSLYVVLVVRYKAYLPGKTSDRTRYGFAQRMNYDTDTVISIVAYVNRNASDLLYQVTHCPCVMGVMRHTGTYDTIITATSRPVAAAMFVGTTKRSCDWDIP